jgi:Na+/proline symporter
MMLRRVEDIKKVIPLSILGYSITVLLWLGIGMAMRALVLEGSHPPLARADDAAPEFLRHYANPVLAGIVFAGLFAAVMSTADSFLNIGAAAIVHDIPRALRGRSLGNELTWARVATVAIAVIAALFALYSRDFVALLGKFGWSIFAGALVPVVAIGFNWKRATPLAANVAVAGSLLLNFVLYTAEKVQGYRLPHGIDSGALTLLTSLTLFFVISYLSPRPAIAADIEAVMDM